MRSSRGFSLTADRMFLYITLTAANENIHHRHNELVICAVTLCPNGSLRMRHDIRLITRLITWQLRYFPLPLSYLSQSERSFYIPSWKVPPVQQYDLVIGLYYTQLRLITFNKETILLLLLLIMIGVSILGKWCTLRHWQFRGGRKTAWNSV